MSRTYFSSDWHIGHANSIIYDKRPFKDLDHMHRVLVNNYNATVGTHDTCYFLGDVGFHKGDTLAKIVAELNGTKILILGNHDKGVTAMRAMGFDVVLYSASLVIANRVVTMSHCPLRGVFREKTEGMRGAAIGDNWHGEHKHGCYSVPDYGQFHLHGHIHSGPANDKPRKTHNQFDVGVVAGEYRPVNISEIESWVSVEEQRKQIK